MTINIQSIGLNARSTARIHRAGAAAIAGAIVLAISLVGHDVARFLGLDGNLDVPGSLATLLSYSSLTIAFGLLFLGSLGLTALMMRSDRRLLKVGAGAVSLGLAGTTLGFGFAALAGLTRFASAIMIGEIVGAVSMMILFTFGSLVLGVAFLRSKVVSRTIAWLMIAVGPGIVLGSVIGVPILDLVLFAGPVCAVWILIGRDLIAADPAAVEENAAAVSA
jgi:hypothetical protein